MSVVDEWTLRERCLERDVVSKLDLSVWVEVLLRVRVMRISLMWCENDGYCRRLVEWMMELEWVVVAKVEVELQQEVVVLQLEVVEVLVLVEVVEWQCEVGIPRLIQSCVGVQE